MVFVKLPESSRNVSLLERFIPSFLGITNQEEANSLGYRYNYPCGYNQPFSIPPS